MQYINPTLNSQGTPHVSALQTSRGVSVVRTMPWCRSIRIWTHRGHPMHRPYGWDRGCLLWGSCSEEIHNQIFNLQRTLRVSPWRMSHGVSVVMILEKIYHVMAATHCVMVRLSLLPVTLPPPPPLSLSLSLSLARSLSLSLSLSLSRHKEATRLVPLPAAIPSSDETGRYAWISRSAGFCRTGSGWPAGRTLQWARPQPTEPHVVRHTYNLRRHETVDLILNSRYLGHARLMITLPTELWSNNLENKLGYNRDFLHYIII